MQEIIELLDSVVRRTTFDARRLGTFSSDRLRAIYQHDKLHGGLTAKSATPKVPENLLAELTDRLLPLLVEYTNPESDRIGNGLVDLMGGSPQPKIAEFARILVRAAAILGAKRVAQMLFGWIAGEPLHYRTKMLLTGVAIDDQLALEEGICITPLPKSSAELSAFVPSSLVTFPRQSFDSFLGGVMLSIDGKAEPVLYLPSTNDLSSENMQHTWARGKLPGLSLNTFCEAMSLACNGCVRWKFSWRDFGELEEFNSGVLPGMSYTDVPEFGTRTHLPQESLEQARDIHLERHVDGKTNPRLDTAIRRWMGSKRSNASLSDRLIDLRIALEALYLDSDAGEMRFRLATNGAWHLGVDFVERRDYYKTLRGVYDLASKAVHASEVKFSKQERDLLTAGQDACRKGILKRLKEKNKPDWNELILGGSLLEDTT